MITVDPVKYESQVPYFIADAGPRPSTVRQPVSLLALPAPRVDPHIEEVERRLGASYLGFQEAMIKQMQRLTDQMSLMIKSQQPGPPAPIESGRHSSGYGVFNVGNRAILVNIVELDKVVINGETMVHLYKINEVKHNLTMVKGTIEVTLLEIKVINTMKKKFTKLVENDIPRSMLVRWTMLWV